MKPYKIRITHMTDDNESASKFTELPMSDLIVVSLTVIRASQLRLAEAAYQ